MRQISSGDNPAVKRMMELHDRRGREKAGLFLLEGPHLLAEVLAAGLRPAEVFFLAEWGKRPEGCALLAQTVDSGARLTEIGPRVMAKIATTDTPPPVLASVPIPKTDETSPDKARRGVVLDGLQDPGNLGTILRAAWAAGARFIWTTAETVDLFSPKVLRSAQGAHFHLVLRQGSRRDLIEYAHSRGWWLAAAAASAKTPFYEAALRPPCLLCIGNEGRGVHQELIEASDELVAVPMAPGVDSLNAAVSAGVILFEMVRRDPIF